MYMRHLIKQEIVAFEWDAGNLDKSYLKHGVSSKEAEEVFLSEGALVIKDVKHSQSEDRFILVGQSLAKHKLFIAFTIRGQKIRVILARKMHKNEINKYEKIQQALH